MKTTLVACAFLLASAAAFAVGDVTAARSAADDLSAALGRDARTGLPYVRVYVVNAPSGQTLAAAPPPAPPSAPRRRRVALAEGSSVRVDGTLLFAKAPDRPCDLIVFTNGTSRLILIQPSGTPLGPLRVSGTVSASGNPLGYECSIELDYAPA